MVIPTFQEFLAEKIKAGWRPPMPDASGGGGGVAANDILGQYGPVVTGPPLAAAPPPLAVPYSSQPLANPGSPAQLGGSSDQLMTVPSGGYASLPSDPNIVNDYTNSLPASTPAEDLATYLMGRRLVETNRAGYPQL